MPTKPIGSESKTQWTTYDGLMTFILPDKSQYRIAAMKVDSPNTLAEVMDVACVKLSSWERKALIAMITQFEMK